MSTTPPVTRQRAKELEVEPNQKVSSGDQSGTDSDFSKDGENTDDRESPEEAEQATEEPKEKAVISGQRIGERLKDLIMNRRKGLKNMYGRTEDELDTSLEEPIRRGEEMARKLIREMGCSREIAIDLTVLALYDVAILIRMF